MAEVPGQWWWDDDPIKEDGSLNFKKLRVCDDSKKFAKIIVESMCEAQDYTFRKIDPNTPYKGKAEASISPYWAH